ncbi:MAG TPA: gluconate 2-dehydrogenase subunit 3 family protein [Oscillatoriaceae cyanobacterium]
MAASINRRQFLRRALGFAAVATTLPLAACARGRYTAPPQALDFFTEKQWNVLHAASLRLMPSAPGRLGAETIDVATAADHLLAKASPPLQAQFRQLLDTFEDWTWLALHFKPFTAMGPEEQDAYLRAWQSSPLALQRQGFSGLNKTCAMLFYMDPRSWPQIGYPGPWIGKFDFGLGLDNQGAMAAPVNPNVYARHSA